MIDKPMNRVVYCYGAWQDAFNHMENVEFYKGLTGIFDSDDFFDPKTNTLLILDDLSQELANHNKASKLFTQGIHHLNISTILIMQNLYKQGKAMRDIHLNTQYYVLFRNCRDVNQVDFLSKQMRLSHIPKAYDKVTSEAFQPIVIVLKPDTPAYLRVTSNIFPSEFKRIFVKEGTILPCQKAFDSSRLS